MVVEHLPQLPYSYLIDLPVTGPSVRKAKETIGDLQDQQFASGLVSLLSPDSWVRGDFGSTVPLHVDHPGMV